MNQAQHPYAAFIDRVQKPARYLGGELFSVRKDPAEVKISVCLSFPDLYDIGMSHLGTKILYKLLNSAPDIACERAFAPWADMEAELRARQLPLVSLESARPLNTFDVLGFSLQYELTFTNVLTILDLAGLQLRAEDRQETDPLILGGGPVATHPEAAAPFFDAFLVGDAEERLPALLRAYKAAREAGHTKREALVAMAEGGGVYVPSLYTRALDPRSGLVCVTGPVDPRVPEAVTRAFVADLAKFPFPDDSPVASAEAIFDRLSVEIARGCTEGCRFCQAGMIYRPVRERDPDEIADTIVSAIEKGGYDEASLTALSTADYSCIDPLVRKIMGTLRTRQVSLGVASLRAYGLSEGVLDEIASVRATGLTFAPEAGTQRMRDIINKNVSDEDITRSAHRVFSRGWKRMKLYFMLGLPMECDDDLAGIIDTGRRMAQIGRGYVGRRAEVSVSASSHVPKPHTPFQWAAMDTVDELQRKQRLLKDLARQRRVQIKYHDVRVSYLEGIMARGDIRVADLVEKAWRGGARFDGWDEALAWQVWMDALADTPTVDPQRYLGTLPVDGRLPWDHIDVGLADGFLAREWRRASKGQLSPPCGKPAGDIVHKTNLQDALADERKLVCYHCGVACDLSEMRAERLRYLEQLRALEPPAPAAPPAEIDRQSDGRIKPPKREGAAAPEDLIRYRLQYVKAGLIRYQGHSDMLRIFPRVLRRAQLPVAFSWGFHPKPLLSFSPATPLGTLSVSEMIDISLTDAISTDTLISRLNAACDPGLSFVAARCLQTGEKKSAAALHATTYLCGLPGLTPEAVADAARRALQATELPVPIVRKRREKTIDARPGLELARLVPEQAWPTLTEVPPGGPVLELRLRLDLPTPRPSELLAVMFPGHELTGPVVRTALLRKLKDGRLVSPMAPPEPAPSAPPSATPPQPSATPDVSPA